MVLLIRKSPNFPHKTKHLKLDHLQSAALHAFNSTTSENFHKLFSDRKPGLNDASISLSWYIPCLKFLQGMNTAFANLVKDLDYPLTKWTPKLAEDYFSFTLSFLDALNSISSCISHVGISRLSLSHAVNLIASSPSSAIQHMKPIDVHNIKGFSFKDISDVGSLDGGKERAVHESMMKMRSVASLVLKVLLCALCGDSNEEIGSLNRGEFEGLNFGIVREINLVREIKEVNEVVKRIDDCLADEKKNKYAAEAAGDLKRKLSEVERLTEIVGKQVDCLFSEVLERRNELITCFRLPKCT
ncbi:hypothetical protein vseg_002276 [Gypsophila vaccaria]